MSASTAVALPPTPRIGRRPPRRAAHRRQLHYTGSAYFGGVIASDMNVGNARFTIDMPGALATIKDLTGQPRVKLGKFGAGDRDWGAEMYDGDGRLVFKVWGGSLGNYGQLRLGAKIDNYRHSVQFDGIPNVSGGALAGLGWEAQLQLEDTAVLPTAGGLWRSILRHNAGAPYLSVERNTGATGGIPDFSSFNEPLRIYADHLEIGDGSAERARVPGIVVSTSSACGDYPEGTIWFRVPA